MTYFLLAAHSKMQEERKRLKEELLSKKEPGLDDLENFSTYPNCHKMLKLGDSLSRKHALGRKSMVWLENIIRVPWKGQKVRLNIRLFTDPLCQLSRSRKYRWHYPRKICGGASFPVGDHHYIHGKPPEFLRILQQQEHCQPGIKRDRNRKKCKKAVRRPKFYRQKIG